MISLAALLVLSYLVGAFPSSVVYGKLFRGVDIREHGSGNAGGTNAWRVLGWKVGLSVMLTDVAKGALASALIARIPLEPLLGSLPFTLGTVMLLCGVAALLGHVFPIYIGFRGGKGVATGAGVFLVNAPIPVACALGVFALMLFLFGKVSLGSVLAAISLPVSVFFVDRFTSIDYPVLLLALTIALALFILYTHRFNIRRLIKGEEKAFPKLQLWKRILRPRK